MPSFIGEPPPGRFPTRRKDHAPNNEGSCSVSCRSPQDSQVELVPDSQDVGSGAAPEGESVADTSDWCSEWSRSPQNRWNEEEKSNQKHDMCEAGEQDERNQQEAGEQKGGAEDTCDCDSESHSIPWSRAGVQEKCSHDESKAGWEKEVEALWQSGKVQGDGQHCTTGGGPLSVWKHGVTEKGALGEREVERQLHVPCGEPRFEGPQVAK